MRAEDAAALVIDAVHDVRGTVGSIRLAVTSVIDDPDDDAFRTAMLTTAADEARRLDAALVAVEALGVAIASPPGTGGCADVAEVVTGAVDAARRRGVQVDAVDVDVAVTVAVGTAPLLRAVSALLGVVADGGPVTLVSTAGEGVAHVVIERLDGARVRVERALVTSLLAAVGARAVPGPGLSFDLPVADG